MGMRGKECRHRKTGNVYIIVDEVKIKWGDMWVPGVLYAPAIDEPTEGMHYVRTMTDFIEAFEQMPELVEVEGPGC